MEISTVRFKFMLVFIVLILFKPVYPAENLCDYELKTLPEAYERMEYSYRLETPGGYSKPVWKVIKDIPPWLTLTKAGELAGTPEITETGEEEAFCFKVELTAAKIDPCNKKTEEKKIKYKIQLKVKKYPRWNAKENYRAICGFEYSGASSADSYQKLFFDLYASTPFSLSNKRTNKRYPRFGRPLTIWGNIKLTSLPRQVNASLGKISNEFLDFMKRMNINEIARGVEFSVGFDWRLFHLSLSSEKILCMSFIGAYGGSNTNTSDDTAPIIYKLPDSNNIEYQEVIEELKNRYGTDLTGKEKEYVAFVNADRKKFFRQLFFGLRFKTYAKPKPIRNSKKQNNVERFEYLFPSIFEVTLGHNDLIVNNDLYEFTQLRKNKKKLLVLSIGGILPIRLTRSLNLYLFGTAMLHFNKGITRDNPLILEPVPDGDDVPEEEKVLLTNEKVGHIPFFDECRDYYRFGIGIEISSALEGLVKKIDNLISNIK